MKKTEALEQLDTIREWLDEVEHLIENWCPDEASDLLAGTIPDELQSLRELLS